MPEQLLSWPGNTPPEGYVIVERNPSPTGMGLLIRKATK